MLKSIGVCLIGKVEGDLRQKVALAVAIVAAFFIGTTLVPDLALAGGTAAHKLRKVLIKLPQTYKETLLGPRYGDGTWDGPSFGYGCEQDEAVRTCDVNTSNDNSKNETAVGAKTVLGPASNTTLFGIKRKTVCTAVEIKDNSGIEGCLFEGCVAYKKPVVMVCVPK
jgi:hypothetical protein